MTQLFVSENAPSGQAQNIALVNQFLDLLEQKDIEAWSRLWADDGIQEMPFAPDGFPSQVKGRPNLYQHYRTLPEAYRTMRFSRRVFYPLLNPDWVLVEYQGEIEVIATGRPYNNRYCGLFQFENLLIKLFKEYFNPTILTEALGNNLGETFNLGQK